MTRMQAEGWVDAALVAWRPPKAITDSQLHALRPRHGGSGVGVRWTKRPRRGNFWECCNCRDHHVNGDSHGRISRSASWRNWQTRWIQNPFPKRSIGSTPIEAINPCESRGFLVAGLSHLRLILAGVFFVGATPVLPQREICIKENLGFQLGHSGPIRAKSRAKSKVGKPPWKNLNTC